MEIYEKMKPYSIPSSIGYDAKSPPPWNGGGAPIYTKTMITTS